MAARRIANTLILTLLTALSLSAAPRLRWLNPTHNFGAFSEEMGPVSCTFLAVNEGDEAAVVLDARANCGCTRPRYDRAPVRPGDTLRVSVSYDPQGRPGRFHKQVRVNTNAVGGPATLNIRGTVIGTPSTLRSRYPIETPSARLSNEIATFGTTRKGRVIASAINIYNTSPDTIQPAATGLPEYIHALFQPRRIAPGEQGSMSLTWYTDRSADYGISETEFTLVPDSLNPASARRIQAVAVINEDFSRLTPEQLREAPKIQLETEKIDFGTLSRSADKPLTAKLKIHNAGHQPMLIRRVYSADKCLSVKSAPEKIKPGGSGEAEILIDLSQIPEGQPLNAKLIIITNSPDRPQTAVRFVGELKP